MNKNNEILIRIIKDLKILRYEGECRAQYISRVIYSALSVWIRVSTLDRDIFEQSADKMGTTKIHILNRCKPFLDNMIEIYPEIREWFYSISNKENPIALIRDRLLCSGELIDIDFDTNLALPTYEECLVNDGVIIIRGFKGECFNTATGLAQFKVLKDKKSMDIGEIFKFYCLRNKSAQEVLADFLKDIKWNEKEMMSVDIFDKYSRNSFSNCWDNEYKLKNKEISIYKYGFFDYGFIMKSNYNIYVSQINKYLIENLEVRRFMYGLKSEINNPVFARYKIYNDEKLVELNLYNALPQKEHDLLLLLGWPIKNISDDFNLLFHKSVWIFIEAILKNLNITLQEVR